MGNYYLLTSGAKEFFPYFNETDTVSIGWNSAARMVSNGKNWNEVSSYIGDTYGTGLPGHATGALFAFIGREESRRPQMQPGDKVIVVGQANIKGKTVIRAVAEVGQFDLRDEQLNDKYPHIAYRDVTEWKYNEGPVARCDLSKQFQNNGEASTKIRRGGTLQEWKVVNGEIDDKFDQLITELEDSPSLHPRKYGFNFKEKHVQEHILKNWDDIDQHITQSTSKVIREHVFENDSRADFTSEPAKDNDGVAVILEIKVDAAGPEAIVQLKEYIDQYMLESNHSEYPKGIVVAEDFVRHNDISDEIGEYPISLIRYDVGIDYDEVVLE